ncbi:hypothetical protein [Peredibacter starrii]|uniref:Uncharacterized protein n=1 Tax=Peredibacter starrii TaxID=28202 RepID=A0AAX4HT54_9BACT|nr:hypothetical protein [Peredibacter starrii]WPU66273.1 hypothetical protein SOO65_05890 [Peredibacter starrii]
MNKPKVQAEVPSKKTRRVRSQFRKDFRSRSAFSFGRAIQFLGIATELYEADNDQAGYFVSESVKSLAHSLEMFSKAVLKNASPFLLLDNIKKLDEDPYNLKEGYAKIENEQQTMYCVGRVAFNRATHFFKVTLKNEEISLLLSLINDRNIIEHRDGHFIQNIQNKVEEVSRLLELIQRLYDGEFKGASVIKDCTESAGADPSFGSIEESLKHLLNVCSSRMKTINRKKGRLLSKGSKFRACHKCYYELALVTNENHYKCLWCESEAVKVKCSVEHCGEVSWRSNEDKNYKCNAHEYWEHFKTTDLGASWSKLIKNIPIRYNTAIMPDDDEGPLGA